MGDQYADATGSRSRRFDSDQDVRSQHLILMTVRLLFLVFMLAVSILPFAGSLASSQKPFIQVVIDYLGPMIATISFASIILLVDILTPNKRLSAVLAIYLGLVAGLVAALAVGLLIDVIAESWGLTTGDAVYQYLTVLKLAAGITLCYLAISIVLTTRDNLRLVIPYVEFNRQVRGVRPMLLDTSVLVDGRIEQLGASRFLDAPLIVPEFVIGELHALADSSNKLKRERGRRGLGVLGRLRKSPDLDLTIDPSEPADPAVDRALLEMAFDGNYRVITTDSALQKVGQIQGVSVLNLNELSIAVRTQAIPGEVLEISIVKAGESPEQGVGYLPDGTMVVVEDGGSYIGEVVSARVSNLLQTTAGRMIFAKVGDGEVTPTQSSPAASS